MYKVTTGAVLILAAICAATAAELPRYRTAPRLSRDRYSSRQTAPAAPNPTGYPAAGVTPEVPFDLPGTNTAAPNVAYLPPDNTYGPPDNTYGPPDNTYGPPDNTYGPPDNTYGPPAVEEQEEDEPVPPPEEDVERDNEPQPEIKGQQPQEVDEDQILVAVAEDGSVISVSTSYDPTDRGQAANANARLVYQRFAQSRRAPASVPARLTQVRSGRLMQLQLVQRPQRLALQPGFPTW